MSESWDVSVFDRIHARAADPWDVETSEYERAKYAATLAELGERRFARGLEVGCSIGAMTALLAARCDALLAVDIAAEPVRRTAERCAGLPQVSVRQARVPAEWPDGVFDLIVISEVLYFLSAADVRETARLAVAGLAPDGIILLVNWTGFTDTPVTGDEAASLFLREADLRFASSRGATYRIDIQARDAGTLAELRR